MKKCEMEEGSATVFECYLGDLNLTGSDLKIAILEPKEGRMAVNLCVGMKWLNGGGHSPPYGTPVLTAVNGDEFTFRGVAI